MFETLERRRLMAAGDVDLGFGNNGFVNIPNLNGGAQNSSVVAAGDDEFYVTGISRIYKRDADGNPILSFGGANQVDLPFDFPTQVVPLAGDKVLVLGETSELNEETNVVDTTFSVVRLNPDGERDTTFGGGDGIVVLSEAVPGAFRFEQIAVQSDGKIIVHGWNSTPVGGPGGGTIPSSVVTRLNADGTPDSTFTDFDLGSIHVGALAVQGDDKIFVGGDLKIGQDGEPFSIVRLNANGTVDTAFGTSGFVPLTVGGAEFVPSDIVPLAGGGFVATGSGALLKFSAAGVHDTSFGDGGRATTPNGGFANVLVAPDGKFVAFSPTRVARFNANGTPDTAFARVVGGFKMYDFVGAALTSSGDVISGAIRGEDEGFGPTSSGLIKLEGSSTGPDRVTVSGSTVTINGTDNADHITLVTDFPGDPTGEIIVMFLGFLGEFVTREGIEQVDVFANGGDDSVNLEQESLRSFISGGDGKDKIVGGNGDDTISGNAQNDFIDGGGGNDRLNGHGGRDKLNGQGGSDRLFGGAGGDWLAGDLEADQLNGEGGNDHLHGGQGPDRLHGNAGDDTLFARGDNAIDRVLGDGGTDSAEVDEDDLLDSIETELD